MAVDWLTAGKVAGAAAPLAMRLINGSGHVGQREANWIQNRENMHWEREREARQLDNTQKLFAMQTGQMADQYRNQFGWLVEGAQKAGFNPLTALGTAATHGGGTAAAAGSPLTSHVPSGDNLGDVLGDALTGVSDAFDPIARERQRLENELMQKRIDQIDNEANRIGQMPEVRTTSSEVRGDDGVLTPNGQEASDAASRVRDPFPEADPERPREAEADLWQAFLEWRAGEALHKSIAANIGEYRKWLNAKGITDERLAIADRKSDERYRSGDDEMMRKSLHRKEWERHQAELRVNNKMAQRAADHHSKTGTWPEWYLRHLGQITR